MSENAHQPELFHDAEICGVRMLWSIEPRAFADLQRRIKAGPGTRAAAVVANGARIPAPAPAYTRQGTVAVIPITDYIGKTPGWWSDTATTDVRAALDDAMADPLVKSILLLIDSPGGTIAGVAELADAIHAANVQKPVVAYAEDLMASAAYWLGSQASKVYGNSTAAVGSIGVFTVLPDFSRMAKNMGVDVQVVKSAPGKGAASFGTPITEPQLADVQKLVDATHDLFVAAVARGRGMPMDKAAALADGRVQIGQAAVESGLMDGVASLDSIIADMQSPEPAEPPARMNPPMHGAKPPCDKTRADGVAPASAHKEAPMSDTNPTAPADPKMAEALAALSEQVKAQGAQIAALQASKDIDAVIMQATADRKLTPALLPVARTIAQHGGLAGLKDYVASLPAVAPKAGAEFVRTGADADLAGAEGVPDAPRQPHDHVSGMGRVYSFKPERTALHQRALAYQASCKAAGAPVSYQQAVIECTRKSATAADVSA